MATVVRKYQTRLQRIANHLLAAKWESADAFWTMQEDLLKLQRDIQKSIAEAKAIPRKSRNNDLLRDLQTVRWHARHLGDALAWLLLGLNRRLISSLGENSPVPISEDSKSSIAMQGIAGHLATQGWGFPILHDVTDCLRIGDITFVQPEEERSYVTVEVKSRLVTESVDDGGTVGTFNVTILASQNLDPTTGRILAQSKKAELPISTEKPRNRVDRQALRMREAHLKGQGPGGFVPGLSKPHFQMDVALNTSSEWKTLRRLIREAHRNGYSGLPVDGAFFYAVLYRKGGLTEDLGDNGAFSDDIREWGAAPTDPKERVVTVNSIPNMEGAGPYRTLPYFLFSIPRRAIFEILAGELAIVVLVDYGRVCDALRSEGLNVELRPQSSGPGEIVIIDQFTVEGVPMFAESHHMTNSIHETIGEFQSLAFLVGLARGYSEGAREVAAHAASTHGWVP